ncbi:MAG TPA: lamin tail domain-containing protein [Pyrinomonadaceae bacterium]|nr:lamin tail domain-containing protein [Pyrinomonadaceae bacterium]
MLFLPRFGRTLLAVLTFALVLSACQTAFGQTAGEVIISEFRWDGKGVSLFEQSNNEFIELYNTTNSDIVVRAVDGSRGWALAADDAMGTRYVIPNDTIIPARGHFLIANASGYSLSNYPAGAGTFATWDAAYFGDIAVNTGIALFSTANPQNFNESTRLDAVGTAGNTILCAGPTVPASSALYREGTGLPLYPGNRNGETFEYSFLRKLTSGTPQDTANNATDFTFIGTLGVYILCATRIDGSRGAPGPENTKSPIQRNATIKASRIDPNCPESGSPTSACARARTEEVFNPLTASLGTLRIRRKFTNMTGQPVTRLRFRVVDISTGLEPGAASLHVLSGTGSFNVTDTNGNTVTIQRLTLEQPPVQHLGDINYFNGALNSTLSAGTIAMNTPLLANDSINVEFLLGVTFHGNFRFFVNVEALTNPPTNPPAARRPGSMKASAGRKFE